MESVDLNKKTLKDLRYIAKMMDIKGVTTYKKHELIEKILEAGKDSLGGEIKADVMVDKKEDKKSEAKTTRRKSKVVRKIESEKAEDIKEEEKAKIEDEKESEKDTVEETVKEPVRTGRRGRPRKSESPKADSEPKTKLAK